MKFFFIVIVILKMLETKFLTLKPLTFLNASHFCMNYIQRLQLQMRAYFKNLVTCWWKQ